MEKIKEIVTNHKLLQIWRDLYGEMMDEVPTRNDVTKILKELGLSKKLITEYGETYYLMCVIVDVAADIEGVDYEWVNKDTLEMKKLYDSEIYSTKQSILYNLNKLLDYRTISENVAEDVKVALDLLDIEEEDEDDDDIY